VQLSLLSPLVTGWMQCSAKHKYRLSDLARPLRLRLDAGWSGGISMRILGNVALCAAMTGCDASRQAVAVQVGNQFIGENVDEAI
jgi:hypothetical protein